MPVLRLTVHSLSSCCLFDGTQTLPPSQSCAIRQSSCKQRILFPSCCLLGCQSCAKQCIPFPSCCLFGGTHRHASPAVFASRLVNSAFPFRHVVYSAAHEHRVQTTPALFASRLVNSAFPFRHVVCSAAHEHRVQTSPLLFANCLLNSSFPFRHAAHKHIMPASQSFAIRQSSCK